MKDRDVSTLELLRRAMAAQIELGLGEMVIQPRQMQALQPTLVEEVSAFPMKQDDIFGSITRKVLEPQYESIEAHRQAICNCQACPLGATRTKFVYGAGSPDADIMFVGEAPGFNEDQTGEPFVGRAGELLDKILAAIQFSRSDVYIANILKCRPPNNRDPQPDEMEQCLPYLIEQIASIRPKLICSLGRIAAQALLKTTTPLGKLRGQWHELSGVPMMVTYHPAALLRFPGYKRDTWTDMQQLKARYDALK